MPIDSYALCPGGTGKAIKFCCKDMVPQLQQLERAIQGGQNKAALNMADRLLESTPDRECLLALKAIVLRAMGDGDAHRALAETFLAKHPKNPIALAEQALSLAGQGKGRAALELIQRAMAASGEGIDGRVYEAMDEVAHQLLDEGQVVAARALMLLQTIVNREDAHPMEMIMRLNGSPTIPLLLKDEQFSDAIPEGTACKPAFDRATEAISLGHWLEGEEQLTALSQQSPGEPAVWRNLATIRLWLADSAGAVEALRSLAQLPIPAEDAAEVQAEAMFLMPDPLGDEVDQLQLVYTIADPDQAQTALAGWTRAVATPVDPGMFEGNEGEPPPKSMWLLLDRAPVSADAGQVDLAELPQILVQALLYGRQTDRPARLELRGLAQPQRAALEADLRGLLGSAAAGEPETSVIGRVSSSRLMIRLARYLPRGTTREQSESLIERLLEYAICQQWPAQPLGLLDGKTPSQAAGEPQYRIKLLAAILVMQQWVDAADESFDFNRLRTQLGLPTLGPIDPTHVRTDRLPLVRLARVEVEKLDDNALLGAYRRVVGFGVLPAVSKYAQALVDRPQVGSAEERETAYSLLLRREQDSERALSLLDRARKEVTAAGRSCARFDMMELPLRLMRGEGSELGRIVNHLQNAHIREPGVAQALGQFLMEIGAIRPDGTAAMPAAPEEQAGIIVPGAPGAEPGKIWTPDAAAGGAKSGKLWTPD